MQPNQQKNTAQNKPQVNFVYGNQAPQNTQQFNIPPMQQQMNQIPQQQMNQIPQQQIYQCGVSNEQVQFGFGYGQGYGQNFLPGPVLDGFNVSINLLNKTQEDKDKKVVAVIVSFCYSMTYDNLFTSVQQKSQQGTRVLVYSCSSESISVLLQQFKGEDSKNQTAKELIKHIKQLDADCVVFNWECSSGYTSSNFPEGKDTLFSFLKVILDRGHMAMFSDFSLKALINQWDSTKLGPNPFKKVGQTSNPFDLHFQRQKLMECPSAQLQIVGEMAQKGKCHVEAMGGTIVYSADKTIKKNDFYTMQILTVAETDCHCAEENYQLQVLGKKGVAGHVLLTYNSGGHILTSMGHWIQLMKIDTSEHKLFEVAEKQYGAQYAQQMRSEWAQMDTVSQKAYVQRNAVNFVQNSAPCQNKAYKEMKSKKN